MIESMIDYAQIGKRIKKARVEKGFTQEQLANDLSLSTFYISKIENGKSAPTMETLAMIADHLDIELAYLITGVSKLEKQYYDNQLIEITSKATNKQLELIIRVAKAILNE